MKKKLDLFGIKTDNINLSEAVAQTMEIIESGSVGSVYTPNAYIFLECIKNHRFKEIINSSEICLPDGEGVLRAARLAGTPISEKVAGVDYAFALMKSLNENNGRLFIYGGSSESLDKAIKTIGRLFPDLSCMGLNGYECSEDEAVRTINRFNPDAVFVCLGSPKQEQFIYSNKMRFQRGIFAALGGTVDIISGISKRAPKFIIKIKLEWLWRAFRQPKRFLKLPKLLELELKLRRLKKKSRKNIDKDREV